jgi:GAF domain-containing protein
VAAKGGSIRRHMSEAVDPPRSLEDGEGQISLLLELMGEINRGAGMEAVFSLIGDALVRFFRIDRFAVSLVGEGPVPHVVASQGLSPEYIAAINSAEESTPGIRAMQAREPVVFLDAPNDAGFAPFQDAARREGFRTVLFFPLYSGHDALGFLVTYHDEVRTYSAAELAFAQVLATQAGVAMAQARLLRDRQDQHPDRILARPARNHPVDCRRGGRADRRRNRLPLPPNRLWGVRSCRGSRN